MDPAKLQLALDDIFDQALLHHGFVAYMRDYEVIVHATADPATGIEPTELRYLFRYCVQANCTTTVPATIWRNSLDDRLIIYETGVDLDGYVWGVTTSSRSNRSRKSSSPSATRARTLVTW